MRCLAKTPERAGASIASVLLFSLAICILGMAPWSIMPFAAGWMLVDFAMGVYGTVLDNLGIDYPSRRTSNRSERERRMQSYSRPPLPPRHRG